MEATTLDDVIQGFRDLVTVKRVYGDPYERNGLTVIPAVSVMLSDILTPVHTDGLTRTGSAQECSGFEGTITLGLAVGLVAVGSVALGLVTLLVGFTNARTSRVGLCGGTRHTSAMSTGPTRISR